MQYQTFDPHPDLVSGQMFLDPGGPRRSSGATTTHSARRLYGADLYPGRQYPAHDFPQRISYTLIHKDSLLAEISGTRNGIAQRKLFPMKRESE